MAALPLLLFLLPVCADAKPDLQVPAVTISGTITGAGSKFTAKATIKNAGSVSTGVSFFLYYYYCPKKSTSGCTYLDAKPFKDYLTPSKALTKDMGLLVPVDALYGTGYVRVKADPTPAPLGSVIESNENNNDGYAAATVTTRPDLLVKSSKFPETGSTSKVGATFTGRVNIGNAAKTSMVASTFHVLYHYCPLAQDTGCILLGQDTFSVGLKSGAEEEIKQTAKLTIPVGAQAGTRYVRVFVDGMGAVTESDESNNKVYTAITVSGTKPLEAGVDINVKGDGPVDSGPRDSSQDSPGVEAGASDVGPDRGRDNPVCISLGGNAARCDGDGCNTSSGVPCWLGLLLLLGLLHGQVVYRRGGGRR